MTTNAMSGPETGGDQNRRAIFQLLRRYGGLSRQQLSNMTHLHRSTLSKIMSELIRSGIASEVGKIEPTSRRVGKKQIMIQVNDAAGWTLGVGLHLDVARVAVMGASGKVLRHSSFPMGRDITVFPAQLEKHLSDWFAKEGMPQGTCLALGVGLSGIVNSKTGVIQRSLLYNVRDYPLARELAKVFPCPVWIFNDARVESYTQIQNPMAGHGESFLYLHLSLRGDGQGYQVWGFGSSLVLDGRLVVGSNHLAGELFGVLKPELKTRLSEEDLKALTSLESSTSPGMFLLADEMNPLLAGLAGVFDPDRLVLGGEIVPRNPAFLRRVQMQLNQTLLRDQDMKLVTVEPARIQEPATAFGAALLSYDMAPYPAPGHAPSRADDHMRLIPPV